VKQLSLLGNPHTTKRCSRCGIVKFVSEFYKNKKNKKDELFYRCKECVKKYSKKCYKNNPEKIKERYKNNSEKINKKSRKWREKNPEKRKEYNKKSIRNYRSIPKNRLSCNISSAIYLSLKGNKKGNHWENLIGFTLQDLIAHLEKQFKEGMNWENMGKWHIDHIRPIASFNFNSYKDKEFKECWTLENLQPLWASENLSKGDTH